jgi:hypothetical protein
MQSGGGAEIYPKVSVRQKMPLNSARVGPIG